MLNVESLDDTPVPDGTPNFAGGLASFAPNTQLAVNQFATGINTMLNKSGVLQTRRGRALLGSSFGDTNRILGLGFLNTAAGVRKLLCIQNQSGTGNGIVRVFDGSNWTAPGGFTPKENLWATIVQALDKLYICQGATSGLAVRTWDGTTFATLGTGATDFPLGDFMLWGTNRMIVAGLPSAPDTIAFSDILDPSNGHWSGANTMRIGAGDGDPITGIAMWTEKLLVVFKRSKLYIVNIDPAVSVSSFSADEVPAAVGCVHHRTITRVGRDLWFLSTDGVRSLTRVLAGSEQEVTSALSLPVTDQVRLIEDLDPSYALARFSSAVHFKGHWLLSHYNNVLGTGAGTTGVYVLAFNTELAVWEGRWTGWQPTCFVTTHFAGKERLVFGGMDGSVSYWRHEDSAAEVTADFQDAGGAIATQVRTRGHQYGADQNSKQGFAVELEFDETSAATAAAADIKVAIDEASPVLLKSTAPAGKIPLTLLHQGPGRGIAFDVSSTAGKLAVRAVRSTAFIQTMTVGQ